MAVQHHKLECPVEKMGLLRSRSRSQRRFKMSVNICLNHIFWATEHFVTKFGIVMQHHEPECHVEKKIYLLLSSRSRSQRRLILFNYDSPCVRSYRAHYLLNRSTIFYQTWFLPNLVWWCIVRKRCVKAYIIKIWLLIPWQPNLVWLYIIISQSVLWKNMDYCIQDQGHSEGSKC